MSVFNVIELFGEQLSTALESKLRRWLTQPEADTLRKIIASKCQFSQATALARALEASKGAAADLLLQDDMNEAARYDSFLKIFNLIAATPIDEPFQIAKLKTTTYENQHNAGSEAED